MYLVDTNILIYFVDGKMTEDQKKVVKNIFVESFTISVISKIEFLGFKDYMNDDEFEKAKAFLSNANVVQLADSIIDRTIQIRQEHKIRLADAIIAATAWEQNLTIVTRNGDDFRNIDVSIFNPFEEN